MASIDEVPIAPQSPWQKPYCERVIGSIPRECLDRIIILNEIHLKRSFPVTSTTITIGELTCHSVETPRYRARLNHHPRDRSSASRRSVDSIIDTRAWLPDRELREVHVALQHGLAMLKCRFQLVAKVLVTLGVQVEEPLKRVQNVSHNAVHDELTGTFAGFVSTHAVGDREQLALRVAKQACFVIEARARLVNVHRLIQVRDQKLIFV